MNLGAVFVDTSGLYAIADKDDAHHREAVSIVEHLKRTKRRVFTINYVLVETHTLLLGRLGHRVARAWLARFNVPVDHSSPDDLQKAREVVLKWGDKTFSLTDAVSFVVMERCRSIEAFAFDEHFKQYGFRCFRARK